MCMKLQINLVWLHKVIKLYIKIIKKKTASHFAITVGVLFICRSAIGISEAVKFNETLIQVKAFWLQTKTQIIKFNYNPFLIKFNV